MVFLGFRNDVSFLVGNEMVLVEHQSTYNPDMPLRGLICFARLYAKLITQWDLDMYSSTPVGIPPPRYFVLYFGGRGRSERQVMDMLFTIEDEERAMRVHMAALEREATERGLEKGMKQGLEQGLERGRLAERAANLRSIMHSLGCDVDAAMDMLGIPAGDREAVQASLFAPNEAAS